MKWLLDVLVVRGAAGYWSEGLLTTNSVFLPPLSEAST